MKLLLTLLLCALGLVCSEAADSRIVNGEDATYGEHPYICSLQSYSWWTGKYGHICGSVIWNSDYIVTAAHCVNPDNPSNYRVICGNHIMSQNDDYEAIHYVGHITTHPGWNPSGNGFPNDIAVLRLSTSLTFTSKLNAFTLASGGDFAGQSCILSGWGRLSGGGSTPNTLQKVSINSISNTECAANWTDINGADINNGHICFHEPHKSACNGDSGGPVRCGSTIVGVTSWGISTCSGVFPSVYTRVSYFYDWLNSTAGPQPTRY